MAFSFAIGWRRHRPADGILFVRQSPPSQPKKALESASSRGLLMASLSQHWLRRSTCKVRLSMATEGDKVTLLEQPPFFLGYGCWTIHGLWEAIIKVKAWGPMRPHQSLGGLVLAVGLLIRYGKINVLFNFVHTQSLFILSLVTSMRQLCIILVHVGLPPLKLMVKCLWLWALCPYWHCWTGVPLSTF